ncbi:hypothetical protein [Nesterenkonia pannonica]|uniref:hypothetical protein n=1 Tax=Nesterenkonia pannonica TaxID=1548602 RepID=UPI0021649A95|nr:hypothetical protein [Nesterenkonia pannonica]
MSHGHKIIAAVAGALLLAAGSFLLTYSAAAESSDVLLRGLWGFALCGAVAALGVGIYGLAYASTATQQRQEQRRLSAGGAGFAPIASMSGRSGP